MIRPLRLAGLLMAMTWPFAASAMAQDATPVPTPSDWGVALAEDARAFHDLIQDNHPGPFDSRNPGFNALLEHGLALALSRAETADSYEDWYFALQEYQAAFDDGHLTIIDHAPMGHSWSMNWPGFITGLRSGPDGDRHEVVFNRDPAAPPVGAVLVSCDGRAADALAEEIVGRGAGRWSLRSRRSYFAAPVMVDQKNPYVRRPERCLFKVDGAERAYDLVWRGLPDAVRNEGFAAALTPLYFAPVELREWNRGFWVGLGSFETDPESADGQKLTALLDTVAARAEEIRAADIVVFDLRGNAGGSSAWSTRIARTLWGDAYVDALGPRSEGADWRPSPGNQAFFEHLRDVVFAEDEGIRTFANSVVEGMEQARAEGRPLWFQASDESRPLRPDGPPLMRGRTYVLTDYVCASACLDAVDMFRAMGAQVVGQETSADTVYMQVREAPLPSRRATAVIPLKVYRGRARGNNETVVPDHRWEGELSDTAGLERLIAGLQ